MKPWFSTGSLGVVFGFVFISNQADLLSCLETPAFLQRATSCSANADHEYVPVDESMHHYMEYMFEPGYHRLKETMANDSPDRGTWKSLKGDAMLLAEGSNILLHRLPEQDPDVWAGHATAVREHGTNLYQAARATDRDQAMESYQLMIDHCNACHNSHAEGEYQLGY